LSADGSPLSPGRCPFSESFVVIVILPVEEPSDGSKEKPCEEGEEGFHLEASRMIWRIVALVSALSVGAMVCQRTPLPFNSAG